MSYPQGYLIRDGVRTEAPRHMADAALAQAAAQNTWYTILDTTRNVRIYTITTLMGVANETVAVRLTIDGNVLTATVAAVAGTLYYWSLDGTGSDIIVAAGNFGLSGVYGVIEGRSVKVEMRKTTANGANTLTGRVKYAQL